MAKKQVNRAKPKPLVTVAIKFRIAKIRIVENELNLPSEFSGGSEKLSYSLNFKYDVIRSDKYLTITVDYTFRWNDVIVNTFGVANSFYIDNIEEAFSAERDKKSVQNFIAELTTVSLNHARGMHALVFKDTQIEKYPIPLLLKNEIEKKFPVDLTESV